jgi:membrane-associated phospholipid phosphatase
MIEEAQTPAGTNAALLMKRLSSFIFCLQEIRDPKFVFKRICATLVFYGACLYLMSISVTYASTRFPQDQPTLPDLGFDMFPAYSNVMLAHGILFVCIGYLLIRTIFHPRGITMIRRFAIMHGICCALRSLTLVSTTYPDPQPSCAHFDRPDGAYDFWVRTVYYHSVLTCGDLMFSGHTIIYTLTALSAQVYMTTVEKTVCWILMTLGCLSLVIVRLHYSSDVIIALYVTFSVFGFYHLFATVPQFRKKIPLIAWMEDQEEHPVHERVSLATDYPVQLESHREEEEREQWP